jgi:glycosyltransferase involved in cell wall biosynthesis
MSAVTSVIIPVRNGARFITEAVYSVGSQLAPGDRIFIVDDASTDDTRSVLRGIDGAPVTVLEGAGHGVSSARNIGLRAARGDFIAFLDHDDLWPAGRHQIMSQVLLANPEYDAAYGRIAVRAEPGALPFRPAESMEGKHLFSSICTGLFRKSLLDRCGAFAEDMQFGEDTDYSLRLMEAGMRPFLCDIVGLLYRRHDSNASNDQARTRAGQAEAIARKIVRARARPVAG